MSDSKGYIDYDNQASIYDSRVGLPSEIPLQISGYLGGLSVLKNSISILEIGCGTGQIGAVLNETFDQYTGFDSSSSMLDVFKKRLSGAGDSSSFLHADGDKSWPAKDDTTHVIFSSRAMHLLEPDHVLEEIKRVSNTQESFVVLGKVKRDSNHPKAIMRRIMRQILKKEGYIGRSGEKYREELFEGLVGLGAVQLPVFTTSNWTTHYKPISSIASWKDKEGLAGLTLKNPFKSKVLSQVTKEAEDLFGDLQAPQPGNEWYELNAVRIVKQFINSFKT